LPKSDIDLIDDAKSGFGVGLGGADVEDVRAHGDFRSCFLPAHTSRF
jgi:hypothetical protein